MAARLVGQLMIVANAFCIFLGCVFDRCLAINNSCTDRSFPNSSSTHMLFKPTLKFRVTLRDCAGKTLAGAGNWAPCNVCAVLMIYQNASFEALQLEE